jgi:hypothetical protein
MNAPPPANGQPRPDRDAQGQFAPGNKGGPGNPFARQVAALRSALLKCVSADDIAALVAMLLDRAKGGDVAACKLLFSYALGKPAPTVSPDDLDWHEVSQRFRCPPLQEALTKCEHHFRPEVLSALDRVWAMAQEHDIREGLAGMLAAEQPPGRAGPATELLQRPFRNGTVAKNGKHH